MKHFRVIVCLGLLLAGCREEQLDMTVVQKTVFEDAVITAVDLDDAWSVTLVNDEQSYVELEYSAFLENYVKAVYQDGQFSLGLTQWLNLPGNTVKNAVIHTNQLTRISLSDATVCRGDRFTQGMSVELDDASRLVDIVIEGESCSLKISDASVLKGMFTATSRLSIDLAAASQMVSYGGNAPSAEVTLSDASFLNLLNTEVSDMHIELNGASEASVCVTNTLEGFVHDASSLYYQGKPSLNVDCDLTSILQGLGVENGKWKTEN